MSATVSKGWFESGQSSRRFEGGQQRRRNGKFGVDDENATTETGVAASFKYSLPLTGDISFDVSKNGVGASIGVASKETTIFQGGSVRSYANSAESGSFNKEIADRLVGILAEHKLDPNSVKVLGVFLEGPSAGVGFRVGKDTLGAHASGQVVAVRIEMQAGPVLLSARARVGAAVGFSHKKIQSKKGKKGVESSTSVKAGIIEFSIDRVADESEEREPAAPARAAAAQKVTDAERALAKHVTTAGEHAKRVVSPGIKATADAATAALEAQIESSEEQGRCIDAAAKYVEEQYNDGEITALYNNYKRSVDINTPVERRMQCFAAFQRSVAEILDANARFRDVIRVGQQAGYFFGQVAHLTSSPSLAKFGSGLVGVTQIAQGVHDVNKLAQTGLTMASAATTSVIGGVMAVVSLFGGKDDGGQGQIIMEAVFGELRAIREDIQQLRAEMWQGFEHTWELINAVRDDIRYLHDAVAEMATRNERHHATLYQAVIQHFDNVVSLVCSLDSSVRDRSSTHHNVEMAYLQHITSEKAREALELMQKPCITATEFCLFEMSIRNWLTDVCKLDSGKLSLTSGKISVSDAMVSEQLLVALNDENTRQGFVQKLGLMYTLVLDLDPSVLDTFHALFPMPAALIDPACWQAMLCRYLELLEKGRYDVIFSMSQPVYDQLLKNLDRIKAEASKVVAFLTVLHDTRDALFGQLLGQLDCSIKEVYRAITQSCTDRMRLINQRFHLPVDSDYLRLFESATMAIKRLALLSNTARRQLVADYKFIRNTLRVCNTDEAWLTSMTTNETALAAFSRPDVLLLLMYGFAPEVVHQNRDFSKNRSYNDGDSVYWFNSNANKTLQFIEICVGVHTVFKTHRLVSSSTDGWYNYNPTDEPRTTMAQLDTEVAVYCDKFFAFVPATVAVVSAYVQSTLELSFLRKERVLAMSAVSNLAANDTYQRYRRRRLQLFAFLKLFNMEFQFQREDPIGSLLIASHKSGSSVDLLAVLSKLHTKLIVDDVTKTDQSNYRECIAFLTQQRTTTLLLQDAESAENTQVWARGQIKAQIEYLVDDILSDKVLGVLYTQMTECVCWIDAFRCDIDPAVKYAFKLEVLTSAVYEERVMFDSIATAYEHNVALSDDAIEHLGLLRELVADTPHSATLISADLCTAAGEQLTRVHNKLSELADRSAAVSACLDDAISYFEALPTMAARQSTHKLMMEDSDAAGRGSSSNFETPNVYTARYLQSDFASGCSVAMYELLCRDGVTSKEVQENWARSNAPFAAVKASLSGVDRSALHLAVFRARLTSAAYCWGSMHRSWLLMTCTG
jgi:hypothetical protein